jgi:SAM-dependent methyltransferase
MASISGHLPNTPRLLSRRLHSHRVEGEAALWNLFLLPCSASRSGTGDGRLLGLVKLDHPEAAAVAIDFSPAMLEAARRRFGGDASVTVVAHDLDHPLPELGNFDAVVSSFAIHHLTHERKRDLYAEVYRVLNPGGVFCNLEHVSSPTQELHDEFCAALVGRLRRKTRQQTARDEPSWYGPRDRLRRCRLQLEVA